MSTAEDEGRQAIEAIIARQFGSMTWSPGSAADWQAFEADFHSDAALYASARPAKRQTVGAFVERMKGLADQELRSFREHVLGTEIRIFGNVAVALAACKIVENETKTSRGIEMMLLVKTDGAWRIVSQAWDSESGSNPIPAHLTAAAPSAVG